MRRYLSTLCARAARTAGELAEAEGASLSMRCAGSGGARVKTGCGKGPDIAALVICAASLVAVASALARAAEPDAAAHPTAGYDDVARLIAGLPTDGGPLALLEQRRIWVEYGRAIDERWLKLKTKQLSKMSSWSVRELGPRSDAGREVLYPFSGPDLINMTTLIPGRPGYVMLSLEPVGSIPDLEGFDVPDFDRFFAMLQQSLSSALKWDFFQTKELREDLSVPGLEGVLPLLLFFAARDGQEVMDVRYPVVGPDGALEEIPATTGPPPSHDGVPGVRLSLRRGGTEAVVDLCYFAVDLGSYSVDQNRAFFSWVAGRGPFTTYLKAASYLMFKPKYKAIERFILEHSRDVLQDDSGIPFTDLQRGGWELALFGSYEAPIPLFASKYQEDLAQAYRIRTDVKPLLFSVGYKIRPRESMLMLATKPDR
jgi:hypothetical protein